MMMIGRSPHPTVQVPPWDIMDDPTVDIHSPFSNISTSPDSGYDALTALQRYLPSNANDVMFDSDGLDIPVDAFSCDNFRMYEFKVRKCARGRSHDWTECPYAHPGEKARRRDPLKYHYSGTSCPDFRKGNCKKGDACEYAHGVFECWLHPARYRTQPCKDGTHCRRRVCFFAHTPEQLRVLPQNNSPRGHAAESSDGSPTRPGFDSPFDSPPMTPRAVNGLAESMRNMQIGMARGMSMNSSPNPTWAGFGSPRSPSMLRPGFMSLPTTPTRNPTRSGVAVFDQWEKNYEEEPAMERVESGRDLRARIYAKLSMENSLDSGAPDVGWVSELVK
ncbi:zinc finger CCCH domain-containing protein 20-like [Lycium ferocissimum]|uniref:zinc finger CCCH domain-containing protein 20-like n=1 Tax=Lycium ferocissimum TaxID=112874 RepID=UPI0028159F78|nr:zinc finger CCCH domain-containing protein 20-like [Lycium ferocissimum]